ncbi:MAG: uroporphyrinogen-III synthase [Pyrobaculum sp.]
MRRVVVASPWAGEAFKKALRDVEVVAAAVLRIEPVDVDVAAVERAVAEADLVVFMSGRAAYRLRELGARLDLRGKTVATAEGGKGAVMVKNAFGVEPQLVADSGEELARSASRCKKAVVFHHGERAAEVVKRLEELCTVEEFYTYRAAPDEAVIASLPEADVYVFFSALAAEAVAQRRRHLLEKAVVVAAGPAVAAALERHGIKPATSPGGRIHEVIAFVRGLL